MRKQNNQPRPGQIGKYWLSKNPSRGGSDDAWCRTWYDDGAKQTRRASLGTSDFREAGIRLARWVIENGKLQDETSGDKVLVVVVLYNYWIDHASKLPNANTAWNGLAYWKGFWGDRTVSAITPTEQRRFRQWLAAKKLDAGGIDRVLSDGRAALNRAEKYQELDKAPTIFLVQDAEDRRGREPMGRPIVPKEMALLFDAANSVHILTYLVIAHNTLARPAAALEMRGAQYDDTHSRVDLNPPGRKQNKKHRPILAVTPTLKPWLQATKDPRQFYVAYGRRPIESIGTAWDILVKEAGLDDRVTPYSIRHGMAREMRKRKVPKEQISLFLGIYRQVRMRRPQFTLPTILNIVQRLSRRSKL